MTNPTPEATPAPTPAPTPTPEGEKTLTQADVDRIVADLEEFEGEPDDAGD